VKTKEGGFKNVDIDATDPVSGRVFMLHGFNAEYAGQSRGYSRIGHAIQEFEKLTDFTAAQIQKAINQSNIVLYTKPSQDEDAPNPFENILSNAGAGPASDMFGASPAPSQDAQNVTPESLLPVVTWESIPEATLTTPGSTGVFNLTRGADLKAFENTAPSDSFNVFVDAFTSYLSASTGMPIEALLMKFGQNFSASRATLIMLWRAVEMWRVEMAADYLNPIVEMWLCGEIAAGRVKAPGWSDPILRAAWMKGTWIGSAMPNIDPSKTAKATEIYLKHGLTTHDRESRTLNGSSGHANRQKLKREYK
jgi:capsid protein